MIQFAANRFYLNFTILLCSVLVTHNSQSIHLNKQKLVSMYLWATLFSLHITRNWKPVSYDVLCIIHRNLQEILEAGILFLLMVALFLPSCHSLIKGKNTQNKKNIHPSYFLVHNIIILMKGSYIYLLELKMHLIFKYYIFWKKILDLLLVALITSLNIAFQLPHIHDKYTNDNTMFSIQDAC